jgi:hypothetical protein
LPQQLERRRQRMSILAIQRWAFQVRVPGWRKLPRNEAKLGRSDGERIIGLR